MKLSCIDIFCGAGGLTYGFLQEKIPVVAGVDIDICCKYPYERNNKAEFICDDIRNVKIERLDDLYGHADVRILAGCAPCQPFSVYTKRYGNAVRRNDTKWGLLYEFSRLVKGLEPEVITMENVPNIAEHKVFEDFLHFLRDLKYRIWHEIVDSSLYGVPQTRKRRVLLASRFGDIAFIKPRSTKPKTVRQAIGNLEVLKAGERSDYDMIHIAAGLSDKNLQRIRVSKPGGTWRDWPDELVSACHRVKSGRTYAGVYGRMEWDKPAPTMTTMCYGYGNGRFGHPDQDRAISLREAAIIQSFPCGYQFVQKYDEVSFKNIGRMIGNAVPVGLGRAIARSINHHIASVAAR